MRYANLFLIASLSLCVLTACPSADEPAAKATVGIKSATTVTLGKATEGTDIVADEAKIEKKKDKAGNDVTTLTLKGFYFKKRSIGPGLAVEVQTEAGGKMIVDKAMWEELVGK